MAARRESLPTMREVVSKLRGHEVTDEELAEIRQRGQDVLQVVLGRHGVSSIEELPPDVEIEGSWEEILAEARKQRAKRLDHEAREEGDG